MFFYSPNRKGERPVGHLKDFSGVPHADGYAVFNGLYERGRIVEAACWAHVRRKFFDVHIANDSAIAKEALDRIGTPGTVARWALQSAEKNRFFNVGGAVRDASGTRLRTGHLATPANRQPNKV